MAITWGAVEGTNHQKTGIEVTQSPTTVVAGTTSVTLTVKYYAYSAYSVNDNQVLTLSGAIADSVSFLMDTVGSNVLVATRTLAVTPSYAATVVKTFAAAISGHYGGATPSASVSFTVAQRPYTVPAAPSALTHVRDSDIQNTASWTNNATTGAPYSSVAVERSDNGGAFVQVASVSGAATSWVDTSTSADNTYAYRVRAYNSAGYSGYTATTTLTRNTPATPSTPVATKTGATSVTLAFANGSNSADATEVYRRVAAGAWGLIATTTGKATAYTDSAVPAGIVDYRVRNKAGALLSGYSVDSNDVATSTPPAAPSGLTPSGGSVDGAPVIRLAWTHNPLDGSAQSAYELQYRVRGGAWTATGKVTSTAMYRDIAAATFAAGAAVEWQVETYGTYATAGAFSAIAAFTAERAPSAGITTPATDATVVTTLPLTLGWSFSDRASLTQASWSLSVRSALGVAVHQASGSGATATSALPLSLPNSDTYTATLTVMSSSGLSGTSTRIFSTAYTPPAPPVVTLLPDVASGTVGIGVVVGVLGGAPATTSLSLYRMNGDTPVLLASGIVDGAEVTDFTPPLNVGVTYRALAVSVTNTTATTDAATTLTGSCFRINFGAGLTRSAVLDANASDSADPSSEQEYMQFAGRAFPVLFSGTGRSEAIRVTGDLYADPAMEAEFAALSDWPGEVVYRNPRGRRVVCGCALSMAEGTGPRIVKVSATLTRTQR